MPKSAVHDSVRLRRKNNPREKDQDLLRRCEQAWNNLDDARRTRERTLNYVFGDQWGDVIEYHNGEITERKYIQMRGDVPLQNNIMISIQNSVVGLYARQQTEPNCFAVTHDGQDISDMITATLQHTWQKTKMPDGMKAAAADYIDGGIFLARETMKEYKGRRYAWTDFCNPNYGFWEGGSDVRMSDLRLIGVLCDAAPGELYNLLCNEEYGLTVNDINEIYHIEENGSGHHNYYRTSGNQQNDKDRLDNISFSSPSDESLCRLIEVWTKETKTRYQCVDRLAENANDFMYKVEVEDIHHVKEENELRKQQYMQVGVPEDEWVLIEYKLIEDEYWYYTYLAPDGTILAKGETPYDTHEHPFTLKLYPNVNSEIHPFMSSIIDQQRYINRLIVMHDMATRSAAKGLTIWPEENIPEGMTREDIGEEFARYDGLIFYKTNKLNPNLRPEIITSNAVQIGTTELLQMELNLTRDITNVSSALQGKTPSAGTSAARYAQETQNATTSLASLLQDFTSIAESVAWKKVMMIKQFYPDGWLVMNRENTDVLRYSSMSVQDIDLIINIKEAAATAAYQQYQNDLATKLLEMNAIPPEVWLSAINEPFAKDMLRQVELWKAQQAAMQQQIDQQGVNQQQVQQAQQMLQAS